MALRGSARPTGMGASASSQASSQASQVIQASTYRVFRALCSVCSRCMPVTGAGVLRVHGPLSNRCAGSGMCPSSASSAAATATTTTLTADANGANGQDPTPVPGPFLSESLHAATVQTHVHERESGQENPPGVQPLCGHKACSHFGWCNRAQ